MENLNYNKILNSTLSVLLVETPNSHIEYNMIFNKKSSLASLSNRDKFAIIEKLIKDGYINRMKVSMASLNNYYITLEGILFIKNGGYISKQQKEQQLKIWAYTKNAFLIFGTISAIVIAILQSIQVCRDLRISNQNHHVCKKSIIIKQTNIIKKHPNRK